MSNAKTIVLFILTLAMIAFAAQFAIDLTSENIASACIVLSSSLAILLYINWSAAIQTHPLSTFALFGFCVTTQLGALLVQSATLSSLTENLRQPIDTFTALAFYQLIAVLAHVLYRSFYRPQDLKRSSGLVRSGLEKLQLYASPSAGTLWIMGFLGLLNLLLGGSGDGVGSKVAQGLSFVTWAPFLIPMYLLQQGPNYCNARKNFIFLFIYMGLITLFGIAANARGLMLSGFMTIGLFALLRAMRSTDEVKPTKIARLAAWCVVLAALLIPITDLVTAMVIARKDRGNVSAVKMIENTIYFFQQPQLLRDQGAKDKFTSLKNNYDEAYFASPLMGRLIETKFHDNALYFGSRLGPMDNERVASVTVDFLWATLPDPVLKALGIPVEKKDLSFSMGDFISNLSGAGEVGGFKTGSGFAQGISIFGIFFPLVYFLICPILFLTVDILAYRAENGSILISSLGMLGIWKMFQYGISAESLQYLFMAVVRGLPQNIILFLLVYHLASLGDRLLRNLTSKRSLVVG